MSLRRIVIIVRLAMMVPVAFAANLACADWESWQRPMIYGATFEQYEPGQALSNTGAVGGVWDKPASKRIETAAETRVSDHAMCMAFDTPIDTGLCFIPENTGDRNQKSVMVSSLASGYETLPTLGSDVRAAIAIHAPKGGLTNFVGWGWSEQEKLCRWFALESEAVSPIGAAWRDVSMRFYKDTNGVVRVQYRIRDTSENPFVPLVSKELRSSWLVAGGRELEGMVSKVELRGYSSLEKLDGSEPQRGLSVGVGNRLDLLFDETVKRHDTGYWIKRPAARGSDYVIDVDSTGDPNTFVPSVTHSGQFVVSKFSVQFAGPSTDDAVPADACARIRVVEDDGDDFRFACLVDGAWVTNRAVKVDVAAKYTIELGLDKAARAVYYKAKKGYGAEGGDSVLLCEGSMPSGVSGGFNEIDFAGAGFLREIKGENGFAQ